MQAKPLFVYNITVRNSLFMKSATIRNHLSMSVRCNNCCAFCMEADYHRTDDLYRQLDMSVPKVERLLSDGMIDRNYPVLLTGGEPTLNENLPAVAEFLKKNGIREISLQTNGRMLSYLDYCVRLARAGITHFTLSIHGSSRTIHDAMTRSPGSFAQSIAGLENLLRLKQIMPNIRICTACTLTRINIGGIRDYLHLMLKHYNGIETVILNPLTIRGNALRYSRQLTVSYSEISETVGNAIVQIGIPRESYNRITITDMPRCIDNVLSGPFENILLVDPALKKSHLARKLGQKGIKNKECAGCVCNDSCPGISQEYANIFGMDEFRPVKA